MDPQRYLEIHMQYNENSKDKSLGFVDFWSLFLVEKLWGINQPKQRKSGKIMKKENPISDATLNQAVNNYQINGQNVFFNVHVNENNKN